MELREPLTPPDCDLRGLPFMPMDVVRILDSDLFALSTGEEFKAALALWCKAWLQVPAASLPDDDRVLAHLSGAGTRWKKLKPMALRGWVKCSDGRYYHPVVAEKANEAWKHRLAQRERANKRWGNADGGSSGNAAAPATAHAVASPTAMQGTGTGTVEGKHQAQPPHQNSNVEPAREVSSAAECFNEVCAAADWSPRNDEQRVQGLSVINGWLALGAGLELILDGLAKARKRDPSPTKSLKRFDSTIRGMRRDQLGGELPVTEGDVRQLTQGLAKGLTVQ
jgi:hypothetical protein